MSIVRTFLTRVEAASLARLTLAKLAAAIETGDLVEEPDGLIELENLERWRRSVTYGGGVVSSTGTTSALKLIDDAREFLTKAYEAV